MRLLIAGGICGLAWASGLRGLMSQVAGSESEMTWSGTFGWILLPGLVVGLLLGWAEHLRRAGGRKGWRWLALAPLALASVLLPGLTDPASFLADGIGGGALAVPLFGMAGGYAMSHRGPVAARAACGLLALAPIPVWVLVNMAEGAAFTAHEAWVAVSFWSLLAVLALGSSIPHGPVVAAATNSAPRWEVTVRTTERPATQGGGSTCCEVQAACGCGLCAGVAEAAQRASIRTRPLASRIGTQVMVRPVLVSLRSRMGHLLFTFRSCSVCHDLAADATTSPFYRDNFGLTRPKSPHSVGDSPAAWRDPAPLARADGPA